MDTPQVQLGLQPTLTAKRRARTCRPGEQPGAVSRQFCQRFQDPGQQVQRHAPPRAHGQGLGRGPGAGGVLGQKTDLSSGKGSKSLRSVHKGAQLAASSRTSRSVSQQPDGTGALLSERGQRKPQGTDRQAEKQCKGHRSDVLEQLKCTE